MEHFWTFFSFPLNLLLAVLWMLTWGWIWKRYPNSSVIRFLLSYKATIIVLTLLILSCLWLGFSGDRGFVRSVFFIMVLLSVQPVVFLIILRGWRRPGGEVRWRFLLIHTGFLLALGAGFWGSPDSYELRAKAIKGQTINEAYDMDGGRRGLGYDMVVTDFSAAQATVSVDGGNEIVIKVNKPYNIRYGEDIYIASVSDSYCILQIVREPYRYFALAGILMLLAGAFMLFLKGPQR